MKPAHSGAQINIITDNCVMVGLRMVVWFVDDWFDWLDNWLDGGWVKLVEFSVVGF